MKHQVVIKVVVGILLLGAAGLCIAKDKTDPAPAKVRYTELKLTQFISSKPTFLHGSEFDADGNRDRFWGATDQSCSARSQAVAPVVAAVLGIVVDWLFSRAASGLSKRLKKRIEEYSDGYSNTPVYEDMFLGGKWDQKKESCVVFQRVVCDVTPDAVESKTASCPKGSGEAELSVGIKLRDEGKYFRVLPFAIHLKKLKPKHHQGDVAVAASVRIQAPLWSRTNAGAMWTSPEAKVASLTCNVSKAGEYAPNCFRSFTLGDNDWNKSQVIPRPPRTTQAIIFAVGEVGEPSQGLKGFSEFMDANNGALSGALSEAFQKKIGLKE